MNTNLTLEDLKVFIEVAKAQGITRAAALLHRAPSSISTRILQMEANLGVPLFLREGKRLLLTPKGKTLLPYAEDIMRKVQEAERHVLAATPGGVLRIGTMESTAATRLPCPLALFHKRFPEVELCLHTGPSEELVEMVLTTNLDAALAADIAHDARLEWKGMFQEELVLVTAGSFPPDCTAKKLAAKSLLTFRRGCAYRERLLTWVAQQGNTAPHIVELSSYHAILAGVAAGMGIAMVPTAVLAALPQYNALYRHPLPQALRETTTQLVWRTEMWSANLEALLACLNEVVDT